MIKMSEKFILDAGCGGRQFWINNEHPNTVFIDNRQLKKPFDSKDYPYYRPDFTIEPNILMDFRMMGFKDKSFKLIIWDPPHISTLGKTSIYAKKYGCLNKETWPLDLKHGFRELIRTLDDYGTLIFKWHDEEIQIKKVLKLFSMAPLFGHTTGSNSKTKWLCFMKIPRTRVKSNP